MRVVDLMKRAGELLDSGVLTKAEESFVSTAVIKFERGATLATFEVSRLREIIDANS
jgi:hypothetical protein